MTALFTLTSFLAAALLFSVQPLLARLVLPRLGGSPAVWTACMLFFQSALLAGYAYAHFSSRLLGVRRQVVVHLPVLLAAYASLPFGPPAGSSAGPSFGRGGPTSELLGWLLLTAGLPFFAVATSAPLLQRWYAAAGAGPGRERNPYFLYAASNAGSLTALLAYPLWIERRLRLGDQASWWAVGYCALVVLIALCAAATWRRDAGRLDAVDRGAEGAVGAREWLSWVGLSLIPSSLMLGLTTYLTTDLAAVPLLWVIPLALYLLSFVVVFGRGATQVVDRAARVLPVLVMVQAPVMAAGLVQPFWIPLHVLTFFAASVVCHGELSRRRPPASRLTAFYLATAVGGALGGVFNAVVAPWIFDRVAEYPLALVAACVVLAFRVGNGAGVLSRKPGQQAAGWLGSRLRDPGVEAPAPGSRRRDPSHPHRLCPGFRQGKAGGLASRGDLILPGVIGLIASALCADVGGLAGRGIGVLATMAAAGMTVLVAVTHRRHPIRFALTVGALFLASGLSSGVAGRVMVRERSFFGVVTVTEVDDGRVHRLFHGSTLHGQQSLTPSRRHEPSTYFDRSGPIGAVFRAFDARPGSGSAGVAVTGVGAGSLACYARPGQHWTFYEIDPAVVRIARDPRVFTYLADCRASSLAVQTGDARLLTACAPDGAFDLIVLDAFTSDAIPVHLLTREAMALDRRKLARGGLIVANITNRYLDLAPVVALLARDAGMVCRVSTDLKKDGATGKQGSIWAVLADRDEDLGALASDARWSTPRPRPGDTVWTDDFSNLLDHFRLGARPAGPGGS